MKLFYRTVTLLATAAVLDLTSLTALAFAQLPPTTQTSAQAFFDRGVDKTFRGDYSGAIEDFSQALSRNPNIIEAYCNRGLIRVGLRDYQAAIEDLTLHCFLTQTMLMPITNGEMPLPSWVI